MEKIKAYQLPPEESDAAFVWDSLTDDDGRLWSVVSDWGKRKAEHGNTPDGWTPDFALAFRTLKNWYADEYTDEWLDGDVACLYAEATRAEECGVKDRPDWQTARNAARKVIEAYSAECAKGCPDEVEYAAKLLHAVTGIEYTVRTIRGCCQGEWAELVIPSKEASREAVEEIEAKYFNTGTEWRLEDASGEMHNSYTWIWNGEEAQLREAAAEYWNEPEVEIYDFAGYTKIANYTARKAVAA